MTKRIFNSIIAVAVTVFVICIALFMYVLYDYFTSAQSHQLKMQTMLATQGINNEGLGYLDGFEIEDCRITILDNNGNIKYDSYNSSELSELLNNKEITDAINNGYGESKYNNSILECTLSSASMLENGDIIRLSIVQNSVLTIILGMSHPLIVILVIVVVISLILAYRLSRNIVKPLNELNLDEPLKSNNYEEINPLVKRIDSQQKKLKLQSAQLEQKKEEFDIITSNLSEGLILLNDKGEILSINSSARKILDINNKKIGAYFSDVCNNNTICSAMEGSLQGISNKEIIEISGKKYRINSEPVYSDDSVSGAVILILDVTDKEKSEQLRQEFTANVSHELKTPLQSISGYAELINNEMVRPEDLKNFGGKIFSEAQRMIRLVEDIIHLSRLDEGAQNMTRSDVDIFEIAKSVAESLEPESELANVSILVNGKSAMLYAIPQLIRGIIFNLCDNAIKYNKNNGAVNINVENFDTEIRVTVSDTGIGIPAEDFDRIFERFYRVDKSHSKEVGGTGLGLSIVKHATIIHNAKIKLKSELGKGTDITVIFPK